MKIKIASTITVMSAARSIFMPCNYAYIQLALPLDEAEARAELALLTILTPIKGDPFETNVSLVQLLFTNDGKIACGIEWPLDDQGRIIPHLENYPTLTRAILAFCAEVPE